MIPAASRLLFLMAASSVAESVGNVRFERRYTADPCLDRTLILTTMARGRGDFKHEFRLNCTDTLFSVRWLNHTLVWEAPSAVLDVSDEISFFRQQTATITAYLQDILEVSGILDLYYRFDTETRDLLIYLYFNSRWVSTYRDGKVQFGDLSKLKRDVAEFIKTYASGIGTDVLKENAAKLENKWHGLCTSVKEMANITSGNYSLAYDSRTSRVRCSLESRVPWFHSVFFNSTRASEIEREFSHGTYRTVGFTRNARLTMCTITFPDGMVAIQTGFSHGRRPTTRAPTATPIGTSPEVSMTSLGGSDDVGHASLSSASGTGAIVAGVLVPAVLLTGAVGLFLYRGRLRTVFPRFRRVPTES